MQALQTVTGGERKHKGNGIGGIKL